MPARPVSPRSNARRRIGSVSSSGTGIALTLTAGRGVCTVRGGVSANPSTRGGIISASARLRNTRMSVSGTRPRSILDSVEIEYPHRVANCANVRYLARRTLRTIAPRSPDSTAARTVPLCQIARVASTVWDPLLGLGLPAYRARSQTSPPICARRKPAADLCKTPRRRPTGKCVLEVATAAHPSLSGGGKR